MHFFSCLLLSLREMCSSLSGWCRKTHTSDKQSQPAKKTRNEATGCERTKKKQHKNEVEGRKYDERIDNDFEHIPWCNRFRVGFKFHPPSVRGSSASCKLNFAYTSVFFWMNIFFLLLLPCRCRRTEELGHTMVLFIFEFEHFFFHPILIDL